jgi:lipopolysaccharide export system protein LptC
MDRYSRMIVWLKVLLPLMALALLSTLFLLSRNVDPMDSIPFAQAEIDERLKDQQITGPVLYGSSDRGDEISLFAEKMAMGHGNGITVANAVSGQIDWASGGRLLFVSDTGEIDMAKDTVILSENVLIKTSSGYEINSERLISGMTSLNVTSPDKVFAVGPLGEFTASAMWVNAPEENGPVQMVFTNGVKLIYDPKIK